MLDIKFIRDNLDLLKEKTKQRNVSIEFDTLIDLDEKRREVIQEVEVLRGERNSVSEKIAELKKTKEDATEHIARMREVSRKIKGLDGQRSEIEAAVHAITAAYTKRPP